MTEEYKIINGKVILSGDEGMQERENVHNVEYVLQLENKIDILQKKLTEAKEEHEKYAHKPIRRKRDRIFRSVLKMFGWPFVVFVLVILMLPLMLGFNLTVFSQMTPMKFWQLFTMCMEIIFVPYGILYEGFNWNSENKRVETVLGLEAVICSLERDLKIEEEQLKKAKNLSQPQPQETESEIVSLESFNKTYATALDDKTERINYLGAIRDALIKCQNDEALTERLEQEGLQSEDIEAAKAFIMKEKNRVYRER